MSVAVLLLVVAATVCGPETILADLDVTILHTNDMHGRFAETSQSSGTCKASDSKLCYGGFARVAHVVRAHRNASAKNPQAPATLFLNAGDTYTGTSWFSVHKWKIAVDFINRLAPDCISFGNHEFDYGIEGILPFVESLEVPLVAANMDFSKEKKFTAQVAKSHVITVRGVKIGIIGYLIPDTAILSSTGDVIFLDEVASINAESERLYNNGIKVIIALGHSGFEIDKKIARECPLVDLVVGGHSNTFLWNGEQPDSEVIEGAYPTLVDQPSGRIVPVVQAYAYTKYVGRLNITINDAGELTRYEGQPILLRGDVPKERDIERVLDAYRPGLEAATNKMVGRTKVDLFINDCRRQECNLGNLLTDAMVEYAAFNYVSKDGWTDVAIAVANGGNFRSSIDIGQFSSGDLLGTLPYEMNMIAFNLKGADVKEMLETSIRSNGETSRGEFLQMSGLRVMYDVTQPVGQRVLDVAVRCAACTLPVYRPLEINHVYRILSNQFLLSGGDGYTVFKRAFNKTVQDAGEIEILTNYIQRRQIIYPEVGGRIRFAPQAQDANGCASKIVDLLCFFLSLIVVIRYL